MTTREINQAIIAYPTRYLYLIDRNANTRRRICQARQKGKTIQVKLLDTGTWVSVEYHNEVIEPFAN